MRDRMNVWIETPKAVTTALAMGLAAFAIAIVAGALSLQAVTTSQAETRHRLDAEVRATNDYKTFVASVVCGVFEPVGHIPTVPPTDFGKTIKYNSAASSDKLHCPPTPPVKVTP